jgi:hypothetical protein
LKKQWGITITHPIAFFLIGGVNSVITIDLGTIEYYDSSTNQFVYATGGIVRFEYSLKVIYDWECKWLKPFLKGGLTDEEMVDFYAMMALDPIDKEFLTLEVQAILSKYIESSHTATTFTTYDEGQNGSNSSKGKIYTAEELYALMFTAQVPIEFENRNINRLFVILKIIQSYNEPPKNMSKSDILRQNSELNAKRRAMLNTKG